MKKYALALLVLFAVSCLPDDILGPDFDGDATIDLNDLQFQQNFGVAVEADFIGTILNEDGDRLSGAQVTVGNEQTTTDQNGVFILNDVSVFEKFAYIKASKIGYLEGSRAVVPTLDDPSNIRIVLLEKNVVGTVNSGEVSEVTFNDSKVMFMGDFIDANDNPYAGAVDVSIHYLKPNEEDTFNQMPGMLFAADQNNDAVSLETYGMMNINLSTPEGLPLNIAETSPATLEFPVDNDQTSIAPETMNLWAFDESVGYWKEEGLATKVGNTYVAEVTHFSWWNCDLPLDYINVCFNLVSESGGLLPNHYVEAIRTINDQVIFAGYTNDRGGQCGIFPANEQITMVIYGDSVCEDEILSQEVVGPFTEATTFDVTVPFSEIEEANLVATINNCEGEPLTNGYAYIYSDDINIFNGDSVSITNGTLDTYILYCTSVTDNYSMIVYDLDSGFNSDFISIGMLSETVDFGTISACVSGGGTFEGDVILETQESLDSFGLLGFTAINGQLFIGIDQFGSTSDISDLSSLSSLNSVSGDVMIMNNDNLSTLDGLDGLTSIGAIQIFGNDMVADISALNNISGSLDYIKIFATDVLNSLEAFSNITSCGELNLSGIGVSNLDELESLVSVEDFILTTISSLTAIRESGSFNVTNLINIQNNDNLVSIDGIVPASEMTTVVVTGDAINSIEALNSMVSANIIVLSRLGQITSLNGLNNFESASSFEINENNQLASLNGLESLIGVNVLRIGVENSGAFSGNPVLSDLCALTNLVTNGTFGSLQIDDNLYNPTIQDIIDGNCSQ